MNANDTPLQGHPPRTPARLADFHLSYTSPFRSEAVSSFSNPGPPCLLSPETVIEMKRRKNAAMFALTHIPRTKLLKKKIKGLRNWMRSTISYYKAFCFFFLPFQGGLQMQPHNESLSKWQVAHVGRTGILSCWSVLCRSVIKPDSSTKATLVPTTLIHNTG